MRALVATGTILMVLASSVVFAFDEATPSDQQPQPSSRLDKQVPIETAPQVNQSASQDNSVDVDPDLAKAAEADQAARRKAAGPSPIDTVQPVVIPITKLNPDISFILDVGGAWFNKANHLMQGGHAIDDNGIQLQGLELAASASVDPYFRFDMFYQLKDTEIEEAFLTTLALPWNLQARAGKMNAAFGRQNPQHLHTWNFVDPPLSHTRFMGAEHFRGPGVELSALMPLPWYLNLIAQAFGTTESLGFDSATFGSSEINSKKRIAGFDDLVYVLRMENFFELSTDWSLLVGFSEGLGQSPFVPDGRTYLHGCDIYVKWRPVSSGQGNYALALTIEYMLRDTRIQDGRLRDHGGYIQLDALLTNRWMVGLRVDTTDLWQGSAPGVPGWQRRASLSLTFLPTHFSKLRLQGDFGQDREHHGLGSAVFLQAEVSAGEHGAHKF